jgi:hypothetical protein
VTPFWAEQPAPVGPGLGSPEPEVDRGWREGQPGSMWMMEWKSRSASSRTAFSGGQERQAQSTAAGVIRLLDGGLRPIPTTRPHPGPPITRTCVRRVHGTVPAPTLRRLASAPLSGPGLCNDIAKVGQAVKNKVRTLSLTHPPVIPGLVPGIPMRQAQCSSKRDGRDRPGHDEGEDQDGERARMGRGPAVSFRGERRREPGTHHR